ncbi:MAG TPA: hypothetical protein VGH42_07845 [Verrucomicrobiae bacterium]|jgi:hypothetical protein
MQIEAEKYKWLTPDFYSKAYDQFIRLYWLIIDEPIPDQKLSDFHLNPNEFRFSANERHPIFWCHDFLRLSTMRLIGQINDFNSDVRKLKVWVKILSQYDSESQKIHLIVEFINHWLLPV